MLLLPVGVEGVADPDPARVDAPEAFRVCVLVPVAVAVPRPVLVRVNEVTEPCLPVLCLVALLGSVASLLPLGWK